MVTGSIAAYRCPDLVRDLRREGAEVQVYATREGLRYVYGHRRIFGVILITVAMIPYMIGAGIVSPLVVAAATRSDPGLSGLASSLLFAVQVLVGAFTAWFFGFFDLSNCKDIALFGLAMTMLSYMAIGFLTIPNLRRKAAPTI